jgi:hypothetical protein
VRVFDSRGREVAHERADAAPGPDRTLALDLGPLAPGIYLAVASDAAGRSSAALKLVRLRD